MVAGLTSTSLPTCAIFLLQKAGPSSARTESQATTTNARHRCNDGAAFPFLFIAIYLTTYDNVGHAIRDWFLITWLCEYLCCQLAPSNSGRTLFLCFPGRNTGGAAIQASPQDSGHPATRQSLLLYIPALTTSSWLVPCAWSLIFLSCTPGSEPSHSLLHRDLPSDRPSRASCTMALWLLDDRRPRHTSSSWPSPATGQRSYGTPDNGAYATVRLQTSRRLKRRVQPARRPLGFRRPLPASLCLCTVQPPAPAGLEHSLIHHVMLPLSNGTSVQRCCLTKTIITRSCHPLHRVSETPVPGWAIRRPVWTSRCVN